MRRMYPGRMNVLDPRPGASVPAGTAAVASGGLRDFLALEPALFNLGVPAVVQGNPDRIMQVEPLTESLPDGRAGDGRFVLVGDRSGGSREGAQGRDDLAGGGVGEAVLAWG